MKLHLIIFLIFISTFSFAQDTIPIDTVKTSTESSGLKTNTNKKKKKKSKRLISFDTIQNYLMLSEVYEICDPIISHLIINDLIMRDLTSSNE